MQHLPSTVKKCIPRGALARRIAPPVRGLRERMLVGLVLLTAVSTHAARAADPSTASDSPTKLNSNVPRVTGPAYSSAMLAISGPYGTTDLAALSIAPPKDFRPRGRSLTAREPRPEPLGDAYLMRETTVWQRLADFRARDQVRVLTLWETGGSSVALLAGKRGDPSLQWTSHLVNRSGTTHGVLDELFSTSLNGFGRNLHLGPHGSGADTSARSQKTSDNPFSASVGNR